MFGDTEKAISYIANIITIITFGLGIFNLLGFRLIPENATHDLKSYLGALTIFATFGSYGIAKLLSERWSAQKPTVLICMLMTAIFVFSLSFVSDTFMPAAITPKNAATISIAIIGVLAFFFGTVFFLHIIPIMYPNGVSNPFVIIFAAFTKSYYVGTGYTLMFACFYFLLSALLFSDPLEKLSRITAQAQ